jgi:CysZ protein
VLDLVKRRTVAGVGKDSVVARVPGGEQGAQRAAGPTPVRGVTGAGRDFFAGVSFLLRGIGMYARRPGLMLLGLLPAVLSAAVLAGALVALVTFASDLADWITPFADHWSSGWQHSVRVIAAVAIVAFGLLLSVMVYTVLTLLIGQPFYEAISKNVDDMLGGAPGTINVSFWRTLPRSLLDSLRLLLFTALCGIPLFIGGFVPVVGETIVPVLGALVGGWALTLELISVPFERRSVHFRDRKRLLRGRRLLGVGFGVATFMVFLIPGGAVLFMPAAVAGSTLLTRRLTGEPDVV